MHIKRNAEKKDSPAALTAWEQLETTALADGKAPSWRKGRSSPPPTTVGHLVPSNRNNSRVAARRAQRQATSPMPSNQELETLKQLNLTFLEGTSHGVQLCSEAAEKLREITRNSTISFPDLQIFFEKIKRRCDQHAAAHEITDVRAGRN